MSAFIGAIVQAAATEYKSTNRNQEEGLPVRIPDHVVLAKVPLGKTRNPNVPQQTPKI